MVVVVGSGVAVGTAEAGVPSVPPSQVRRVNSKMAEISGESVFVIHPVLLRLGEIPSTNQEAPKRYPLRIRLRNQGPRQPSLINMVLPSGRHTNGTADATH